MQLHVHGLSNHNERLEAASMQHQTFWADTSDTQILWWTDHREAYLQLKTSKFSFKNGVYDSTTLRINNVIGNKNVPTYWQGYKNGGQTKLFLTDSSFTLQLKSNSITNDYQYFKISPRVESGLLKGNRDFVRPLPSRPIVSLDLKPTGLTHLFNSQVQLIIYLSTHHYNGQQIKQSITYNFIINTFPFSRTLIDSSNIIVNIPVANKINNHVNLDLQLDASFLKDGLDNNVTDWSFKVQSRKNKLVNAKFSNITFYSEDTSEYSQYLQYKSFADYYTAQSNVTEYIGIEVATNEGTHLNGYLPDSSTNRQMLYYNGAGNNLDTFSSLIHQSGGITSYNHPFGFNGTLNSDSLQDYETDTLALHLINNSAHDATLLEVGYVDRGGADLNHHLKLWDILTANRLYLYGDGVNDNHGGNWYIERNRYSSWVWATDSSALSLIEGIKSGKMYFGDLMRFKGRFMFYVDSFEMGKRIPAVNDSGKVSIVMDSILLNSKFRLTQGLLNDNIQVTYLHNRTLFNINNPPFLDFTQPCFVRVEVTDANGKPYLFSNPVVFTEGTETKNKTAKNPSQYENEKTIENYPSNEQDTWDGEFCIYPNPTSGFISLYTQNKFINPLKIDVLNALGMVVKSIYIENPDQNISLDFSDLTSGIYLINLSSDSFKQPLKLIIK
ncbi:MAG: T9SS type A sorting domain-containing protein [Bacteroidetes bacterium]|nr:T9SS type A sorting domain-containing protein [Bacteroidota bacterium]